MIEAKESTKCYTHTTSFSCENKVYDKIRLHKKTSLVELYSLVDGTRIVPGSAVLHMLEHGTLKEPYGDGPKRANNRAPSRSTTAKVKNVMILLRPLISLNTKIPRIPDTRSAHCISG